MLLSIKLQSLDIKPQSAQLTNGLQHGGSPEDFAHDDRCEEHKHRVLAVVVSEGIQHRDVLPLTHLSREETAA